MVVVLPIIFAAAPFARMSRRRSRSTVFYIIPRPPISTLFPYTTLFRSRLRVDCPNRSQHALANACFDNTADRKNNHMEIDNPIPDSSDSASANPPLIRPEECSSWIVFEDEDLLAINKTGGIVCHPSKQAPW